MIDPKVPLVDLHRHLDGNILPPTILKLAQKNNLPLAKCSLEDIAALSQIHDKTSDLLKFLEKLDIGVSVLVTEQDCYDVAYENMRDAKLSGLDYVELRFSPYYMAQAHQLDVHGVVESVVAGVQSGVEAFGVKANLIGILSRTYGQEACMQELDALLLSKESIKALDLAGDELGYPAQGFVDHFTKARDAGWHITVHAGEADGPKSIWNAIEMLGATRIGHGVAAAQDDKLMDYMAKHAIAVESCPTSNYQTGTVADLSQHPIRTFLERGLLVTLNTDDPAVSNIKLADEYELAYSQLGFSQEQLKTIQSNGVLAAFLSKQEKESLWAKYAE